MALTIDASMNFLWPLNQFKINFASNDLITYARLDVSNKEAVKAFRLSMKRRLFFRCMRNHPELFQGRKEELAPELGTSILKESYLWNDVMEDEEFCREKLD